MASGSVFKRVNKRGPVWGYVVELGRDALTGKRDQRRVLGWPTKRAAEAELRKALGELDAGGYVAPSAETVGAYLLRWLAEVGPSWREATRYGRAGIVRNRLIPHLGAVPLAKLTALQVQACYRALGGAGLAPSTVAQTHAVLHGALAQAVEWPLVPRNVADRAKLPANDPPEPAA